MINFDYNAAYKQGHLSEFLYEKSRNFDFDRNGTLNSYEYSQFQKWFSEEDIEKYSLDTINFTHKDKVKYFKDKALPDNIKNDDCIKDSEKNFLKGLNIAAGIGAISGVIGACSAATVGANGAIGILAVPGAVLSAGGIAVALICSLGAWGYKKHLENKIEKNSQQDSISSN